jgi:hypothetical protein
VKKSYGRQDQAKVNTVKQIYNECNLKEEYEKFEDETFKKITHKIGQLQLTSSSSSATTPKQVEQIKFILNQYAKKIFKRNK